MTERENRAEGMPKVQIDEQGPWIDLGHGSAIRPCGPTRFKEGDEVEPYHFGGSTLRGLGKIEGKRGVYQEVWISAPASRPEHERYHKGKTRQAIDFEFAWRSYLKDLAALKRGNPTFNPKNEEQSLVRLKNGRERWLASVGYMMGMMAIMPELVAEGQKVADSIRAQQEARLLALQAPEAPSRKTKSRM